MGRFLLILGIILMIVGFTAPMLGMGNLFASLQPTLDLATNSDVQEAELCEEGEHLEQETGMSTYTQGVGYASSVALFCVDEEGERREVTGDFADSLLGANGGLFSNIGGFIGQTFLFVCIGMAGVLLTIIGAFMSIGAKRKNAFGMPTSYVSSSMPINTNTPSNWQGTSFGTPVQTPTTPGATGLTQKLQELETAYRQNLLTREEYEAARQKILDSMGNE